LAIFAFKVIGDLTVVSLAIIALEVAAAMKVIDCATAGRLAALLCVRVVQMIIVYTGWLASARCPAANHRYRCCVSLRRR